MRPAPTMGRALHGGWGILAADFWQGNLMRGVLAGLLVVLAGCSGGGDGAAGLVVRDWWVRAPLPGQEVAAGYGVLVNDGDAVVRVVRVESDCCRRVEMHRSCA